MKINKKSFKNKNKIKNIFLTFKLIWLRVQSNQSNLWTVDIHLMDSFHLLLIRIPRRHLLKFQAGRSGTSKNSFNKAC